MGQALVVGGGLAGMGAALFLRKLGREVALFEKMPRLAPLARGFSRRGVHFDTGFHYAGGLGDGGALDRYLDALGVLPLLTCVKLPDPGGETLRFFRTGVDFPIARGRDAFGASLGALHPDAPQKWQSFADDMFACVARSPYLNPNAKSFDGNALYSEGATLAERLAALALPARARAVLGFRCLLYGVSPEQAYFNEFSLVNAPYVEAAASIAGGGEALVGAFETALAKAGVTVHTSYEVSAIELDRNNSVAGIRIHVPGSASGEVVPGERCIYCGPPAVLPGLLPPGALRPVLANRLLRLKETPKPFIMFGVTRSGFFARRQLFLCPGDDLAAWFPKRDAAFWDVDNAAFYVSGGEGRDGIHPIVAVGFMPDAAAGDGSLSGLPGSPAAYRDFKERTAEALRLRLLETCPEFAGDLSVADTATDLTLRRWSFNSSGAIYGKIHGAGSPPVMPMTRVGGLALAGQDIILPGALGVLVSAAVAVGSLLGHDQVLKVLA